MRIVFVVVVALTVFFVPKVSAQGRCVVRLHDSSAASTIEAYVADDVDVQPQFPGGDNAMMRFINNARVYPRRAYRAGVEGRVLCSFVVMPNGALSNVSVVRGVEEQIDNEAVRVIKKMPLWHPGTIGGNKVPVYYMLTIPFRR